MSEAPIQWFPGHMAASLARMQERLEVVDVVAEVVDARIPRSSANPALERIALRRPCVKIFTRSDLADPTVTQSWAAHARAQGRAAIAVDAKRLGDLTHLTKLLEGALGGKPTGRIMILGIPNSGKSTIINGLVRRTVARVENRAGVTRSLQWFRISKRLEILDSPGILMPKLETRRAQWLLALTGAVPKERYDVRDVLDAFHQFWRENQDRAGIPSKMIPDLETFAMQRGFRRRGDQPDIQNAASAYLKTFNEGGFGRFSFELVDDQPEATPVRSEDDAAAE